MAGGSRWLLRDALLHCRLTRTSAGRWSRFLARAPSRRTEWSGPALFWPTSTTLRPTPWRGRSG